MEKFDKVSLHNDILKVLRNVVLNKGDVENFYFTEQFLQRKDVSHMKLVLVERYNLRIKNIEGNI